MKILLINKFLYRKGGAEISALNMGKLLATKEYKVILWGMKHPENPDYIHKDLFVSYVYFKSGDEDSLARAIMDLYKHPEKRKAFADKASEFKKNITGIKRK